MASELSTKPSWLQDLEKAIKRNKRDAHNRYFQLATVDCERLPRVRTVVFRGFGDQTGALLFITDSRSEKWAVLKPAVRQRPVGTSLNRASSSGCKGISLLSMTRPIVKPCGVVYRPRQKSSFFG